MKKWLKILGVFALFLALTGCHKSKENVIKVGVVGEKNNEWEYLQKELKEKEGLQIELVKFTDYRAPIEALEQGEIDLHACLTEIYMDKMNKESGRHNTTIGYTTLNPMGIFSKKISSIDALKDGGLVAIPNDVSNESRALLLLQEAGLIQLDKSKSLLPTVHDITENPKNLQFKVLESNQTARAMDEVDISLINNDMAANAGLIPTKDAIFIEKKSDSSKPYWNVIAADVKNKAKETYKTVVKYYQTEKVAQLIDEKSKGSSIPIW